MNEELRRYLIQHYSHLLSKEENQALSQVCLTKEQKEKWSKPRNKEGLINLKIQDFYGFDNPKVDELVALGQEKLIAQLTNQLLAKHSDKVFLNYCPKCNELARTPKAKQCRFCNHSWR